MAASPAEPDRRLDASLDAGNAERWAPGLPPIPAAFVRGESLELLKPLGYCGADELPPTPGNRSRPDRAALAEGLAVANESYGHPEAGRLAARLADPGTEVVVTGQQTGLFGGPLYTLAKAIGAVLWAERLTAAGRPAVAVFWMATEDHDFREVARTSFLKGSELLSVDLGDDPSPLLPVGMRALGPGVERVLAELRAEIPGERFEAWLERVGHWYRPTARFGEAFARLLVDLLGARCPLLLDAMLPAVKKAEQPWLKAMVGKHRELAAAYEARDRAIESAGFELQVAPQPGASPLFYLHGGERRRLEIGDAVGLRGVEGFSETRNWLEEVLRENPAAVSPGVLARPAIQDAILGTTLQVLGPGEVSYMPQVAPAYETLGVAAPRVALRPHLVVAGSRQLEKLGETGVTLGQLLDSGFDLDRALAGDEAEELVPSARADLAERLDELGDRAREIDATLESPFQKTRDRIDGALEAFGAKVLQAAARRDAVRRQRVLSVREICRPGGAPQERVLSSAHFPGKYGESFAETLFENLDLDGTRMSVIRL